MRSVFAAVVGFFALASTLALFALVLFFSGCASLARAAGRAFVRLANAAFNGAERIGTAMGWE